MTRIIVAEDSRTQAQKLRLVLESAGFEVEVAGEGQAALEQFRSSHFDLVLSDVMMPRMDGYELCREIKSARERKGVPVILLTALNDPMDIITGLGCGADNFITKPYNTEDLLGRIDSVLRKKGARVGSHLGDATTIVFMGREFTVSSNKEQILNFLISTFEDYVRSKRREQESKLSVMKQRYEMGSLRIKEELARKEKVNLEQYSTKIEMARRELEEKARELQLASRYKSEFLANMSHELRTPLNSLLILSKSLADNQEGNLTEEQTESARIIHSGGQDLLNLINDILDLSKVEAGKLSLHIDDVQFEEITEALRRQFDHLAEEKGLQFMVEVADDVPPTLKTDSQRTEQILRNLLSNAFKFTSKGSVSLHIHRPDPGVRFYRGGLTPGAAIAMSVIDTGIGIPEDKQNEIFEAFQQLDGSTSRNYGGTGLGLTISREMAKFLGGEIHLESQPGEGSRFTLYLPLTYNPKAGPGDSPASGATVRGPTDETVGQQAAAVTTDLLEPESFTDDQQNIREGDGIILIVEDDAHFARILVDLSHKKGYKCLVARDGQAALRLASQYTPNAILLDLILPDIDGLNVLDDLKHDPSTRHIPVYVISVRDEKPIALQNGAIGYLVKPASSEALDGVFAKIEDHLRSKIKQLLVIEDDAGTLRAISNLLKNKDINITGVVSGEDAIEQLRTHAFDCIVLDLVLGDMSGFDLLRRASKDDSINMPPVIVYTAREISDEERQELSRHAQGIVIKGANSPERLLEEVSLFLHCVETPAAESQEEALRTLRERDQALRGRTVLLVDDDMRNTFALSKALRQQGMEVIKADNGQFALERLDSTEGIELVIMDIMMPVMDGYEATRRIRAQQRFKHLPVIALTAKAMREDRQKCMEAGANDYLAKPVDVDRLLSMIRALLPERQEVGA